MTNETDSGKRLRAARKAARLTQAQAAKILGVVRETVAQYESGRYRTPPNAIERIQRYASVQPVESVQDDPLVPVLYSARPMRSAGLVPAHEWGDPLASEVFVDVDPRIWQKERFCASVAGISCYPALHPGDFTVWHTDKNPKLGTIVLAERFTPHKCSVKVLRYDDATRREVLMPLNAKFTPADDDHEWNIFARLVYVQRDLDGLMSMRYLPGGLRPEHLTLQM